jgi:hypothetical protein
MLPDDKSFRPCEESANLARFPPSGCGVLVRAAAAGVKPHRID